MKTITIGMDLGDKKHQVCVLDAEGKKLEECEVMNTVNGVRKFLTRYVGATVMMETGTHSPWVSREVEASGCHAVVGNARKLRAIYQSPNKSDERDAEMLGRIGRCDRKLLSPVRHRGLEAQVDLEWIKARDKLVEVRTKLINHVRSVVKGTGHRLGSCSAESFGKRARREMPGILKEGLEGMLESIETLSEKIRDYQKRIEDLGAKRYPETLKLRQVPGVGAITSLAYVLTLEEPGRFERSRAVGAWLGLTPRRDQSGETDRALRISKAGNEYLRRLLVSCAQYLMGPFGPDCHLRRWAMKIAVSGGRNAKRRAVVALARKLAVVLHRLWVSGEDYQPFYPTGGESKEMATAA